MKKIDISTIDMRQFGNVIPPECHRDHRTIDWNPRPAVPGNEHGSIELVEVIERPDPGKLRRGIAYALGFMLIVVIYTAFVCLGLHAIICGGAR